MGAKPKLGRRYIQKDHDLIHSRAIDRIAASLGQRVDRWSVLGRLDALYDYCWEFAPEGFIEGPMEQAVATVEAAMGWDRNRHGKRGLLVQAMVANGLLRPAFGPAGTDADCAQCAPSARPVDHAGLHVCGWWERYGSLLADRAARAKRRRDARAGSAGVASKVAASLEKPKRRPRDSHGDSPRPRPGDSPRDKAERVPVTVPVHVPVVSSLHLYGGVGGVASAARSDVPAPVEADTLVVVAEREGSPFQKPPPPAFDVAEAEEAWDALQDQRAARGLLREEAPPDGFGAWLAAARKKTDAGGIARAYTRYLQTPAFEHHVWLMRVFMSEAVWSVRTAPWPEKKVRL